MRKDAYETFYKAYRGMKNTLNATYATSVKGDVFQARAHRFEGALEATLHGNGVPVAVYEQLIEAVHEIAAGAEKIPRHPQARAGGRSAGDV